MERSIGMSIGSGRSGFEDDDDHEEGFRDEAVERIVTSHRNAWKAICASPKRATDLRQNREYLPKRAALEALQRAGYQDPNAIISELVGHRVLAYGDVGDRGQARSVLFLLLPPYEAGEAVDELDEEGKAPPEPTCYPSTAPPANVPRVCFRTRPVRRAFPNHEEANRHGPVPVCLVPAEERFWRLAACTTPNQPRNGWSRSLAKPLPLERLRSALELPSSEFDRALERFIAANLIVRTEDGYRLGRNPRNVHRVLLADRPLVLVSVARLERVQVARAVADRWMRANGFVPRHGFCRFFEEVVGAWQEPGGRKQVEYELVRTLSEPPPQRRTFDGSLFVQFTRGLYPFPPSLAPADLVPTNCPEPETIVPPGRGYGSLLFDRVTWRSRS